MEIKQRVESIVRELVAKMEAETVNKPKVLYIFGDSTTHEAYSDHWIHLDNQGIAHDRMFLDGETSAWLGQRRIESGGPGKVIAVDEFAPAPLEIPQEYDGIVIPEIDIDNLGRATLGLRGTVLSDMIFAALVASKFVLIGEDISGLKRADRRTLKTLTLPKPYQNLFDYYKRELTMYGASFAPGARLAEVAAAKCGGGSAQSAASPTKRISASADASAEEVFQGKLVSAEWVKQQLKNKSFTRLTIGKGTLLSPLAKDMLKEKGIAVHYADER